MQTIFVSGLPGARSKLLKYLLTTSKEITALVRPSSAKRDEVHILHDRAVDILIAGVRTEDISSLAGKLSGFNTIISAVGRDAQLLQLRLIDAAKKAGVQRFVPCAFMTIGPPGGVMLLRDEVSTFSFS